MKARRSSVYVLTVVVLLAATVFLNHVDQGTPSGAIDEAFRDQVSDFVVQIDGKIDRVLRDDRDGSRHQRFVIEIPSGLTVLVAHNIDLAPRVEDLEVGEAITVRGEYEWNEQGGVIHWTHHDPQGRREGGWIEYRGQRYE